MILKINKTVAVEKKMVANFLKIILEDFMITASHRLDMVMMLPKLPKSDLGKI